MMVAVRARETTRTTRNTRDTRDARDMRRNVTDGSLAVELEWAVRRRELEHAGEAPRRQEQERKLVRVQPRRKRQPLPVSLLVGGAVAAALAFQVLMSCIALTRLSSQTVELNRTYQALQTEHATLQAEYDEMFAPAVIRDAAEAMGMVKPDSARIVYVGLPAEDSAVVYRQKNMSVFTRMAQAARHGAGAVVDYFT